MKKSMNIAIAVCAVILTSCNGWIKEPTPGKTSVEDFYTSAQAAVQNVNAAYVPLGWEFNNTYFCEWFIGDVVSDDALKGGQYVQTDMGDVYDMENFKTISNNGLLLEYYRAQYQGIQRCNLVLHNVPSLDKKLFETSADGLQNRIIGEAKFLRAMYYFRLVRVFGGIPVVTDIMESSDQWKCPRASIDSVYNFIIHDLEAAEPLLWEKNDTRFTSADMGRVTKGAAQAMLLKVNLYRASAGYAGAQKGSYEEARKWGDKIISTGVYSLCGAYKDNFTLEGENGPESVFEIQYMADPNSDYGEGNGFTRGTFSVVLTRSRSEFFAAKKTGWGFNKPTINLYNEYEESDPRRDVTIFNPTDKQITVPSEEIYLGDRLLSRKYAMYTDDNQDCEKLEHHSRGPINNKVIRYADVLLMYAEACVGAGGSGSCGISATDALNKVRSRASMPQFPGYKYKVNGVEMTATNIEEAIRHERRVELAMEGHRWFDICRWGVAKETMDAYIATESAEARAEYGTFIKGKHELFPIPSEEITLNPMDQNPGY